MPRENSKCRKWEKERRDRLKEGFSNLAKTLPCYDPSINVCKIDVLNKAASNIQELQDRIKHLLSSDTEKNSEKEIIIKKLQDRVKKLLVRNEQLSNLLRDAGITVPSVCGTIKKFKKQPLWSKRISPEQAKQNNEMEKENISVAEGKNEKSRDGALKTTSKNKSTITNGIQQKRRARRNRKRKGVTPVSNCYIVLSQTVPFRNNSNSTQQYYLITNQPGGNVVRNKVKTGGLNPVSTSKLVVGKTKPRPLRTVVYPNPSLSTLGPGTLILENGIALPVLPQAQSVVPNSNNIIINPAVYTIPKVIQTQNINSSDKIASEKITTINSSPAKTLPFIKPKYCLTQTTQINKVPIPALTSRYASSYCLFNESREKKDSVKIKKSKKGTDQMSSLNLDKSDTKKEKKRKIDTEEEPSNKKSKNDLECEISDDKTPESNTIAVSSSAHVPCISVTKEDINKITTTATAVVQSNCVAVEQAETVVIDDSKTCDVIKNSAQSENIEIKEISSFNVPSKKQEVPSCKGKEDIQISPVVTSTVTTTSVTAAPQDDMKGLEINLTHSELSNDIFASLQVPSGCQNPESTSPTAAFLLAFPLVSSGVKVTEVIDGDNSESQSVTPTLLQIGTMDTTKSTQSQSDVLTSNFLNLEGFSFFSSKDICGSFDNNYPTAVSNAKSSTSTSIHTISKPVNNQSSVYVNAKTSSLPICVPESVKHNSDIFCKKSVHTAKTITKDVRGSEKLNTNHKFSENAVYTPQIQNNLKPHFSVSKVDETPQKSTNQKPQYRVTTTYPSSTCDFNYRPDLTKTCTAATCSYTNINRNYNNPLYTNCSNYNYNYHPDTNFNQNYYKNISHNETKAYYPLNYEYPDYHRKNDANGLAEKYYDASNFTKEKKGSSVARVKTTVESKQPINWMTTPDNRVQSSECLLPSFSKSNFNQSYPFTSYVSSSSSYFSTATMDANKMNCALETKKSLDLPAAPLNSHQRLDIEEKQFSWSPTKLPHFIDPPPTFGTATLPTLVGDLALGNTLPFNEQKNDYIKPVKENKDFRQINKVNNYENQSNFLSVSQLVDHNKPEIIPAKASARRNSGNRSKNNAQHKSKRVTKQDNKDILPHCGFNNDNTHQSRPINNFNNFSSMDLFTEPKNKSAHKNSSSSYSAEALIGNTVPDEAMSKRYPPAPNKSLGTSSFLAENIISYLPQENYITQNQNYQTNSFSHNLTSFQNNTYSSNNFIYTPSTIAPSYLGTNNFDTPQDYLPENANLISNTTKDNKHYNIKNFNKEDKNNHHSICSNNKRAKKKITSDTNGLFDFPFLPIPGSNNSPILPDDFHSHTNFLAPTAPFSCKNSLYPKQNNDISGASLLPIPPVCRSTIQHPEISPSINAVGTSLTNFNLSTIFPEINKGPTTDMYQDTRIKDHLHHKSYSSIAPQVPFNAEPKFHFST